MYPKITVRKRLYKVIRKLSRVDVIVLNLFRTKEASKIENSIIGHWRNVQSTILDSEEHRNQLLH